MGADDEAIGHLATRHLIERGCRRIAHIAGPPLTPGVGRLKGYREALAAAGIAVPDSYVVHATDDASGYLAARRLLALEPRPDAIFGYNDPTAAGAMKAILEAGIAIPEEVKVIGVGNVHYSDLLRVPLSTIDQSSGAIGQKAADMLIKVHRLQAQAPRQDGSDRPHTDPPRIYAIVVGSGPPERRLQAGLPAPRRHFAAAHLLLSTVASVTYALRGNGALIAHVTSTCQCLRELSQRRPPFRPSTASMPITSTRSGSSCSTCSR